MAGCALAGSTSPGGRYFSEVRQAEARGRDSNGSLATCLDSKLVSSHLPLQRLEKVGEWDG